MDELKTAMDSLGALFGIAPGHLAAIMAWLLAAQTAIKLLHSVVIEPLFNRIITYVATTPEKDDDAMLYYLLKSAPYRWASFLFDVLLRIKLPNVQTVFNVPAEVAASGNTEQIVNPNNQGTP